MIHTNYRFRFPVAVALSALCALLFLVSPATAATDLESRARDIDNKLMAPCCGANTVREHDSGPAMQMRAEIRQMLADGKSEREILDHFVMQHGEKILAMPAAQGFNLLAYLLPVGFLVFGGGFLYLALRRWQKRPPAQKVASDGPVQELDPVYLERLRNEVEKDS
jgi:cytochrome c-type biogenesis protein CcmH